MKNKTNTAHLLLLVTLILGIYTSCKKDYVVGGSLSDTPYIHKSNYDALATLPQFDTLIQLIDAAGLKEDVNNAGTVFAPTDRSILAYLNNRTLFLQNTEDLSKMFLLDSLNYYLKNNINGTRDSLRMYLLKIKLTPDILTEEGTIYETGLVNDKVRISFEETTDGNNGYTDKISSVPHLLYYTQNWGGIPQEEEDERVLVKTAFIKTQNSVINVLEPGHVLFFYGR